MRQSGCCQKKYLISCFASVFALAIQVLFVILTPLPLYAQTKHSIKIGVLAKRGYGQAIKRWSPTATYLNQALPTITFEIVPLNFETIPQAVAAESIDFVITNSAFYVHLEHHYGISRIATLKNMINKVPEKQFGSVIFTRADRTNISSFADLKNIRFSAVDEQSLGGWQMASREFHTHGISPKDDFLSTTFVGTHDQVVLAVLSGASDVGTVRTDTLERMAGEGKIDLADIKIIPTPGLTSSFPYLCSTRLYPEWPFAKLKHTSEHLAEMVSIALLSMPPDSTAAQAASISGWTVPLDYQPIHDLLRELHLGPYQHHLGRFTLKDLIHAHKETAIMLLALFILLIIFLSILFHLNHKLHQTKNDLSDQLLQVQGARQNYQEIFNGTNEAIFVHDINNGAILDVNQAMSEMYGYSIEEAKEISVGALSSGEYPYNSKEASRLITKTLTESDRTFEWHAKKKDGSLFWVEVTLKLVIIGGEKRLLGVVHDITEKKNAADQLQRYRDHLEEMVRERTSELHQSETSLAETQRLAHLGSWEWRITDGNLWWSDETYRIFGLDPEDSPADYDSFLTAIHPGDRRLVEQAIDNALHGKEYDIEHRIVRPDGSIRIVQERGKTFSDDSKVPQRMFGSVLDITERKKIEQEQQELKNQLNQTQKLEAIGTMAGGIAHDFNNILGAINGYTELALMKSGKDDEITALMEQVMMAGNRAKDLVSQILTFSRKEKLERHPISIAAITKESLKLLRATIPTNIDFQSHIEAEDSQIMADPTQIHQIVLNLCTNAHHAMEKKQGGILHINLVDEEIDNNHPEAAKLSPGSYIKLSISDNGSGISPENLDRIFDPFFTTKGEGKGTGMGLAVVHGIVQGYKGDIIAQSQEGQGSTFTIYLPKLSDKEQLSASSEKPQVLEKGNEKILFVDDEPTLVDLGKLILDHLGYKTTAINSSSEALEMIRKNSDQFDALITDQSMPKMTGCQLAKEVWAIRPDLPIILCSGHDALMQQQDVKDLGLRHFIQKPYNTAIISKVLREALDNA